ncbi:acetyltransferase (GNAT) family protein [Shimia isoporae]|uniref:Acetyltransferase (GNAT) family protein n=1 Tax=Shimia isoporae TaxID=647720 RepID=A0A4R1N5X7_9RHOB|nr:GNAT family N-acetyltransferase [Shimia isoporae]TCL01482.1 acetyltransferase (GNAT) family protein [Shimia isoporae]
MPQTSAQNLSSDNSLIFDVEAMAQGQEVPCLKGYVAKRFQSEDEIPHETANEFLMEYIYTQAVVFERATGVSVDAAEHIRAFWAHIDRVLPPQGNYYLIWSDQGQLVGTAALRRVDDATGEMKHLYVRPEARGTGLGRWLAERRIQDAQSLGFKCLIADTVRGNVEMPALYAKLGFKETEPNEIGTSVNVMPTVAAGLRFFRKEI